MKKNYIKWISSILATLVTILISYAMGVIFTFISFAFCWALNFLLMIWYTFLVSQIHPKLDSNYFKAKPFEKEGKIYKYLGVHLYRKLLRWIGWERISRQNNPVKNNLASLKLCEYNTRVSELGHTIIAVIVFITAICLTGSFSEAKWYIMTNLLLNVYPIMVQRLNRPRYNSLIYNRKVIQ